MTFLIRVIDKTIRRKRRCVNNKEREREIVGFKHWRKRMVWCHRDKMEWRIEREGIIQGSTEEEDSLTRSFH